MGPKTGQILADVMQGCDPGLDLAPYAVTRFGARALTPA